MSDNKDTKVLPTIEGIEPPKVVSISGTQEFRVQLVKVSDIGVRVAVQKYWRASTSDDWKPGKGFFATGRQAVELGKLMEELGRQVLHVR